jgi:hypothetical protein
MSMAMKRMGGGALGYRSPRSENPDLGHPAAQVLEDRLKSFLTKNIERGLASFTPHFGVGASKTTALPRHTLGFVAWTHDRDATNSGSGDRLTKEKGVIN